MGVDVTLVTDSAPPVGEADEKSELRRELGRLDTVFFLISAMVVVDTIGAIAIRGAQAFTWLGVLFVSFFVPSALMSAELGAALPHEGGAYVWVRTAFWRFAGALTSLVYWAGTPIWLGDSVAVVALSVYERFIGDLSNTATYLCGAAFVGLSTLGSIVPLRFGKWIPTSGAIGQIALLVFFTFSVTIHGFRHGVHGVALVDFTPSSGVLIAVVPVLIYSFVGVELPSTAAEEMLAPRRDIPVAIARAGVGRALMYAIPTLVVLPAGQITSLHGFVDAMKAVYTVYGGSVAADGTATLSGLGQVFGVASALVFIWVLMASGAAWIMGAGPRAAYLLVFPSFLVLRRRRPDLERPFRVPGGPMVAWLVTIAAMGWTTLRRCACCGRASVPPIPMQRFPPGSRVSGSSSKCSSSSRSSWCSRRPPRITSWPTRQILHFCPVPMSGNRASSRCIVSIQRRMIVLLRTFGPSPSETSTKGRHDGILR